MVIGQSVGDVLMLHFCSASSVTAMTLPFAVPHLVVIYTCPARLTCLCQYNHVHDEISLGLNAHSNQ